MNKKIIKIYDLDGTLSKLNNTFDFIFLYYKKKSLLKYLFFKVFGIIVNKIPFVEYYKIRKIYINTLFTGLNKEDLEIFFKNIYFSEFEKSLTDLGRGVLKEKNDNIKNIMLTGCTDIPAILIGEYFGFKNIISTEFLYENGKVKGIKKDTYGNFKCDFIDKKDDEYIIYYTDDEKSEYKLKELVNEFILV